MVTINDLTNYLICPNISRYSDRNKHFKWNTFDLSLLEFKDDIVKFIAIATNELLLDILIYSKEEVIVPRPEKSLQYYESKFNNVIWDYFEMNPENIKLAAHGWVRLLEIYKKIIEITKDYSHAAENIDFNKRIFGDEPISISVRVPLLLMNKDGTCDCLYILPLASRHASTKLMSMYNYFVLEYLKECNLKVKKIHEISYDQNIVSKNFSYSNYLYNEYLLTFGKKYFEGLQNGRYANLAYCPNCPYINKCNYTQLTHKIVLK